MVRFYLKVLHGAACGPKILTPVSGPDKKKGFIGTGAPTHVNESPALLPAASDPGCTMKKMKDLPRLDRPREKIAQKGVEALSDQELIEAIIGRGTRNKDVRALSREIALLVAEKPPDIRYDDLREIEGIGPTKAAQVMACFELGRRCFRQPDAVRTIQKPEDIMPLIAGLGERRQEHFISITLNGAGEVIATRTVTIGILNHSLVHPREVFADAITDRAASIICVHNHPSGSLEPSPQDIAITRQLQEAGTVLGIQLIDHIIVTKNGFCSMRERGLL